MIKSYCDYSLRNGVTPPLTIIIIIIFPVTCNVEDVGKRQFEFGNRLCKIHCLVFAKATSLRHHLAISRGACEPDQIP